MIRTWPERVQFPFYLSSVSDSTLGRDPFHFFLLLSFFFFPRTHGFDVEIINYDDRYQSLFYFDINGICENIACRFNRQEEESRAVQGAVPIHVLRIVPIGTLELPVVGVYGFLVYSNRYESTRRVVSRVTRRRAYIAPTGC